MMCSLGYAELCLEAAEGRSLSKVKVKSQDACSQTGNKSSHIIKLSTDLFPAKHNKGIQMMYLFISFNNV